MLTCAESMAALDFSALMEVYRESNEENGVYFWPNEPAERQRLLAEQNFETYLRDDFFGTAHGRYYLWTEDGRYLAALRLEEHEDGLLLEALETRPDSRRRGHAKALISAVLGLLPPGTRVYSHVNRRNGASLAAHRACGFSEGAGDERYALMERTLPGGPS